MSAAARPSTPELARPARHPWRALRRLWPHGLAAQLLWTVSSMAAASSVDRSAATSMVKPGSLARREKRSGTGRSGSPSMKSTTTSWPMRGVKTAPHFLPAMIWATRTQQDDGR